MRITLYTCILVLIFLFCAFCGQAQNLYDREHTRQFADYLFSTGQYDFAATEYSRSLEFDRADTNSILHLIKSYRLAGHIDRAKSVSDSIISFKSCVFPASLGLEYLKILLLLHKADTASFMIDHNKNLFHQNINDYRLCVLIDQRKWHESYSFATSNNINDRYLKAIALDCRAIPFKSPILASSLSLFIPGSGQAYVGKWKEGILTLLVIVVNGWQASRSFYKEGKNSVYGWSFTGLTLGFYGHSIYQSWHQASTFNKMQDDKMEEKFQNYLNSVD
jgi:hypothetical protein